MAQLALHVADEKIDENFSLTNIMWQYVMQTDLPWNNCKSNNWHILPTTGLSYECHQISDKPWELNHKMEARIGEVEKGKRVKGDKRRRGGWCQDPTSFFPQASWHGDSNIPIAPTHQRLNADNSKSSPIHPRRRRQCPPKTSRE